MTPLYWILLIWSVGTCISSVMLIREAEDGNIFKELNDMYGNIYTQKFIMLLFYIAVFVNSFLWWWLIIPQLTLKWIRIAIIIWIGGKILDAANKGKMDRVNRLTKLMKVVSHEDGKE